MITYLLSSYSRGDITYNKKKKKKRFEDTQQTNGRRLNVELEYKAWVIKNVRSGNLCPSFWGPWNQRK